MNMNINFNKGLRQPITFNGMEEQWRDITEDAIPGIHLWYMVSTYGRVYSKKSNKILTPVDDHRGYSMVCLYCSDDVKRNPRIHRLVMLAFNYIPNHADMQVNHINGIKNDNNICNLEWVTASENNLHAFRIGLSHNKCGEDSCKASITNDQAEYIAYLISLDIYRYEEISRMVNCKLSVVVGMASGVRWKYYYDKYGLCYIRNNGISSNSIFRNAQIHQICKYFEDNNISDCNSKTELFIGALRSINMEYNEYRRRILREIYARKRFTEISSLYNF